MKKLEQTKELSLEQSIKELEGIVRWFDEQNEVDLEEGLKKVKRGNELVELSKKRLQEVENEFKEITKER